jgi:hypothetical protein
MTSTHSSLCSGYFDDLHVFDPAIMAWTHLLPSSGSGTPPSARNTHGFTTAGGRLYVHGGAGETGVKGRRGGGG